MCTPRVISREACTWPRRRETADVRPRLHHLRRFPTRILAALCRERILENPDFAALVGPLLQAATAAAPTADGETSADVLIDFSENFM
ncbi:hypothetical protein MTO96_034686 [Rhipicephalus appendiculatus]